MIKILVKSNNGVINNISINGHANFASSGKDIVCASVSSILITTVNAIISFDKEAINYNETNNFYLENIKKDNTTNILLLNMVSLFKELESKYNKNINLKEETNE